MEEIWASSEKHEIIFNKHKLMLKLFFSSNGAALAISLGQGAAEFVKVNPMGGHRYS